MGVMDQKPAQTDSLTAKCKLLDNVVEYAL